MSLFPESQDITKDITESVRGWAWRNLMPGADDRDETCTFDLSLYRRLDSELGLMNTTLPESLLGADLDITAPIAAIEAMSECDPAIALSFLSQELLFSHQLYHTWKALGQPLPKRHADILRQKRISGMAMTEPNAGTDVLGMSTTATQTDSGFVLNGTKQWITNATVGDVFLVYARSGEQRRDISLFLVETRAEGVSRLPCDKKMGMRSSPTGILTFSHVALPKDALVGTLHEGLRPMLRNLAVERLALAAQSCGIAKTCLNTMRDYARQRHAFEHKIADFGQIQKFLAESYAQYRAMRTMLYETVAETIQSAPQASLNADATKIFCAKGAEDIARSAIQVLGANGYSHAYPVSRLYRDAVLLSIGGGTNEALQKNISRLLMTDSRL